MPDIGAGTNYGGFRAAVCFHAHHARQAALARRQWHRLEQMYQTDSNHRYFVKAAIVSADPADVNARAYLVSNYINRERQHSPAIVAQGAATNNEIAGDDKYAIDPFGITDWRIETPAGVIGPADVDHVTAMTP